MAKMHGKRARRIREALGYSIQGLSELNEVIEEGIEFEKNYGEPLTIHDVSRNGVTTALRYINEPLPAIKKVWQEEEELIKKSTRTRLDSSWGVEIEERTERERELLKMYTDGRNILEDIVEWVPDGTTPLVLENLKKAKELLEQAINGFEWITY